LPSGGIRKAAERIAEFRADDVQGLVDGNPATRVSFSRAMVRLRGVLQSGQEGIEL
jgi:hypothetical protein